MKQIKDEDKLENKIIDKCLFHDGKVFIMFKDETYTIFTSDYENLVEIESDNYSLTPTKDNCYDMLQLGIIEPKEYERLKAEKNKAHSEWLEQKELRQLEELKKKYDNK